MKTLFLSSLLLALAPLTGCGPGAAEDAHADDAHAEDGHDDDGDHGDEVALTEAQADAARIETAVVREAPLAAELRVPAQIVPTETGRAQVGALVDGRVVRLLVAEGQSVRRGATLAAIESPEVARLQGEYLQARARGVQAEQQLGRSRQLAAEDLISTTLLEQAVADARATEAQAAALAGEIRAHGGAAPSSPGGVTGRVTVSSPISGVVSGRQAELGAFVSAGAPLYEVVAPGQVYADADVAPEVAGSVARGTPVTVEAPGGRRYRGTVQFVGAEVAGETRTATVRIRVENATAELRPATFVTALLDVGPRDAGAPTAITVPAEAVERDGAEAFVYVPAAEPRTYARRPVMLGQATGDRVEVASGLAAGERVVTRGVFALKSFRQRGELSGHDH